MLAPRQWARVTNDERRHLDELMGTQEKLPPNYGKLDVALRSVGYTFEAAVADIVDNSIDADARNVAVRLVLTEQGRLDLAVWDDGKGMSARTLREAMRFGADVTQEIERLGKFGLGLKLASLGQAKELRVISSKNGELSGRAWLEEGIKKGFECYIKDADECQATIKKFTPDLKWSGSGTLVVWHHLYRVGVNHTDPQAHAQKLLNRIRDHLALSFHRFLADTSSASGRKPLRLFLDIFDAKTGRSGLTRRVDCLNPFGYDRTGCEEFPSEMSVDGSFAKKVQMRAHIWPPKSKDPEYKLPGGANKRQGFYFYRNNRLIQAGGWNGIRDEDTHVSLARVEIDFAPDFDVEVSLDVKKMNVALPPDLARALQRARTPSGCDFKKYLGLAEETYRTRTKLATEQPAIPSTGLPAGLRSFLEGEYKIKGAGRHRRISFCWEELPEDEFFSVDVDENTVSLNSVYRREAQHGLRPSSTDTPVLKCLLFMVVEDAFYHERIGPKLRARLDRANRVLIEALSHERSL